MLGGMDQPDFPRCWRSRLAAGGVAAAVALLAGCGGGGDDGPAATNTTPDAPAAPVAPAPPVASRAACGLPAFASEALSLVNAHRAAGASCGSQGSFAATTPLAWQDTLSQAALRHSDDMVANNFFSHTGSDGSNAGQRATAAGYAWSTWGENIAAGQPTVSSVVAAWMASDGHCANLMNARFRDIGLACVSGGAGNAYRSYWTMALGAAR
jgi:uncharacterized protein YkwD